MYADNNSHHVHLYTRREDGDIWEEPGLAQRAHGRATQLLLPQTPNIHQDVTREPTPPPQLPPTTRIIYTDGSSDDTRKAKRAQRAPKAGWGFLALCQGDGKSDDNAQCTYKAWGDGDQS